jgi:hypothetical protein
VNIVEVERRTDAERSHAGPVGFDVTRDGLPALARVNGWTLGAALLRCRKRSIDDVQHSVRPAVDLIESHPRRRRWISLCNGRARSSVPREPTRVLIAHAILVTDMIRRCAGDEQCRHRHDPFAEDTEVHMRSKPCGV